MRILAIETSCDDTSIALIKTRGKQRVSFDILSNIVSSQVEIHKEWGGVYPTLAKREHQRNLVPVLIKALKKAKELKASELQISKAQYEVIKKTLVREPELLKHFFKVIPKIRKPKVDALAITVGPGLEPCLWVGINFARALAYFWQLPLIPVNHIEAHLYANYLNSEKQPTFSAVCLIVSGGHTQLILMKDYGQYRLLGETRDDAAGECLDKIARILGLGYPGGPAIAKQARQFKEPKFKIELPRPMIKSKDYEFSFSGLKTAVLYDFKKRSPKIRKDKSYIRQMSFESQQAVIEVLIHKTLKAARDQRVRTIILGGGVAANQELRKQIKKAIKESFNLQIPKPQYCTDNAAMTAVAAYFHHQEKKSWQRIEAKANLRLTK